MVSAGKGAYQCRGQHALVSCAAAGPSRRTASVPPWSDRPTVTGRSRHWEGSMRAVLSVATEALRWRLRGLSSLRLPPTRNAGLLTNMDTAGSLAAFTAVAVAGVAAAAAFDVLVLTPTAPLARLTLPAKWATRTRSTRTGTCRAGREARLSKRPGAAGHVRVHWERQTSRQG